MTAEAERIHAKLEAKGIAPCFEYCKYCDEKYDDNYCKGCRYGGGPENSILFELRDGLKIIVDCKPTKLQDSGERRKFESGAVRDVAEGKGRCDLLPLDIIANFTNDEVLADIAVFMDTGAPAALWEAAMDFISDNFSSHEDGWLELAKHFEDGCKKYGERNWEKGIPLHCYIDSGVRHYFKFMRGDTDERHDRAFIWNMVCAVWTLKHHPELNDVSKTKEERRENK